MMIHIVLSFYSGHPCTCIPHVILATTGNPSRHRHYHPRQLLAGVPHVWLKGLHTVHLIFHVSINLT